MYDVHSRRNCILGFCVNHSWGHFQFLAQTSVQCAVKKPRKKRFFPTELYTNFLPDNKQCRFITKWSTPLSNEDSFYTWALKQFSGFAPFREQLRVKTVCSRWSLQLFAVGMRRVRLERYFTERHSEADEPESYPNVHHSTQKYFWWPTFLASLAQQIYHHLVWTLIQLQLKFKMKHRPTPKSFLLSRSIFQS